MSELDIPVIQMANRAVVEGEPKASFRPQRPSHACSIVTRNGNDSLEIVLPPSERQRNRCLAAEYNILAAWFNCPLLCLCVPCMISTARQQYLWTCTLRITRDDYHYTKALGEDFQLLFLTSSTRYQAESNPAINGKEVVFERYCGSRPPSLEAELRLLCNGGDGVSEHFIEMDSIGMFEYGSFGELTWLAYEINDFLGNDANANALSNVLTALS